MDDEASIRVIGTVQRVFNGAKVTKVNIKCNLTRQTFVDVTAFEVIRKLKQGDKVVVVGHISAEKSGQQEVNPKTGRSYEKWIPLLVVDDVEVLDSAQRPMPGTARSPSPHSNDDVPF